MFHSQTVTHLLSRGLGAATTTSQDISIQPTDPEAPPPWEILRDNLPGWAVVPVSLTILVFVIVLVSVRYTLMGVVATLAQVETPTAEYVSLDANKDDDQDQAEDSDPAPGYADTDRLNGATGSHSDPEVVLVSQRPITSSIRGTLRHISNVGGFRARWRGLAAAVCTSLVHGLVYQILLNLLSLLMPQAVASVIGGVLTTVVLARWYMAWTHIVISDPSPLAWYRRVPTFRTWKNIWAPTAINALAAQVPVLALMGMFAGLGLDDAAGLQQASAIGAVWKLFLILLVALVAYLALVLPSEVALTRCQASMLPDEDESIVPFDRSFGGKVTPAIVGGSGMLSFIDAWKSFDRPAMRRIVKLYVKIFAIDMALHLFFFLIVTLELVLFMKTDAKAAVGPVA